MGTVASFSTPRPAPRVAFQRPEMSAILDVYGRLVMAGEAKDYGVGMHKDHAVFAIYHRYAEKPTWTVTKTPKLAHAQGSYAVMGAQGQVLKRGKDLQTVLRIFDKKRFSVV